MKRFLINAAAFMAMAAMVSCGTEPEAPSQGSRTGFALSFFKNVNAIVEKGENVVVSPYSAGVALSMLAGFQGGEQGFYRGYQHCIDVGWMDGTLGGYFLGKFLKGDFPVDLCLGVGFRCLFLLQRIGQHGNTIVQ